jgi:mRNA-degrading endonuclease YafQ of YafQ-DinJ toxin-antitoxin module
MENPINDELFRLTVKHDKIQLEKAKGRFEKSFDELLKEQKVKLKDLDVVVRDLIDRLTYKQKQFIKNDIDQFLSKK